MEEFNKAFFPWKIKLLNNIELVIRVLILGTPVDSVEIPHLFNINAHSAYYQCCLCDFCGKNVNNKRYFYRKSKGIKSTSSRITRKYRKLMLSRLGSKKNVMIFQGNSKYIDKLLSFFSLSVCFSDSLHVIYEGIDEYLLKIMKKQYPIEFNNLIQITDNLKCPRQEQNHLKYGIDGPMNGIDKKYFFFYYGIKCIALAGYLFLFYF